MGEFNYKTENSDNRRAIWQYPKQDLSEFIPKFWDVFHEIINRSEIPGTLFSVLLLQ